MSKPSNLGGSLFRLLLGPLIIVELSASSMLEFSSQVVFDVVAREKGSVLGDTVTDRLGEDVISSDGDFVTAGLRWHLLRRTTD